MSDRVLRAVAVGSAVYVAAFFAATLLLPETGLAARIVVDVVYPIPEAAAAFLLVLAGRRSGSLRWFWYLASLAMLAGLIGDGNWAIYDFLIGAPPTPSVGDIAYVAQPMILMAAFAAVLPRWRPTVGDVVDLLVPCAAGMFAMYEFVIEPQLAVGVSASTLPAVTESVAMLALAVLATSVVAGLRGVPWSVRLFYAGVMTAAVSYPVYTYAVSLSSWQRINWVYTGFQVFFLLTALAALTRIRLGPPEQPPYRVTNTVHTWLITAGLVLVLVVVAISTKDGKLDRQAPYVAIGAILLVVVRLHQVVRRQARLSSELAASLESQRRLATTDWLTNIANRRAFDERLAEYIDQAARSGGSIGLVVFDLDHFKRVNDGFGHPTGDEVLRSLTSRLSRTIREADGMARIGGEEFAIIAPAISAEETVVLAERCRAVVAGAPFIAGRNAISITTSAGTAHYPTDGRDADSLVQVADRALYEAKEQGRNRVQGGSRSAPVRVLPIPDNTALAFLQQLADQLDHEQAEQDHSLAMLHLAGRLSDHLRFSTDERRRCLLAARLHDIGKVGVPNDILMKRGPLAESELRSMRDHVRVGVELLRRCPDTREVAAIVADHHERPDGSGYPMGKTGAQISAEAKVVSVLDAWTAMLADRPYRRALTQREARQQLLGGRGSQFDARVVDALMATLDDQATRAA